jgi:hypothetical protein
VAVTIVARLFGTLAAEAAKVKALAPPGTMTLAGTVK